MAGKLQRARLSDRAVFTAPKWNHSSIPEMTGRTYKYASGYLWTYRSTLDRTRYTRDHGPWFRAKPKSIYGQWLRLRLKAAMLAVPITVATCYFRSAGNDAMGAFNKVTQRQAMQLTLVGLWVTGWQTTSVTYVVSHPAGQLSCMDGQTACSIRLHCRGVKAGMANSSLVH